MNNLKSLCYHAGGVEKNGNAVLFVAPTQTGKSTLVTFLTQKGFSYISDDSITVDASSLCVVCDPKPLRLRLESVSVLEKQGCVIHGEISNDKRFPRIIHMPKNVARGVIPISKIFFIARTESNKCKKMPPNVAVQLLNQNLMYDTMAGISSLKCGIALAEKCYSLEYSDMNYVKELILND